MAVDLKQMHICVNAVVPFLTERIRITKIAEIIMKTLDPSTASLMQETPSAQPLPSELLIQMLESEEKKGHQFGDNDKDVERKQLDKHQLQLKIAFIISALNHIRPLTLDSDGLTNTWILKPSSLSRGRDIELCRSIEGIKTSVNAKLKRKLSILVCQKYIERPLIIFQRKFDIRQWVLVTKWCPLVVWRYRRAYCRFAVDEFEISDLKNKFRHLTNNAVSKQSSRFHSTGIPGNMWTIEELQNYMSEKEGSDIWSNIIDPQVCNIVASACQCASSEMIDYHESRAHELFGFDLLVDVFYNVWLLEINAGPDLSRTTTVTSELVTQCLSDVLKIILDWQNAPANKRKNINTGEFELLVNDEPLKQPHCSDQRIKSFVVQGERLTSPAPVRRTRSNVSIGVKQRIVTRTVKQP